MHLIIVEDQPLQHERLWVGHSTAQSCGVSGLVLILYIGESVTFIQFQTIYLPFRCGVQIITAVTSSTMVQ